MNELMLKIVANVIPVLNGRDQSGNIIYLGPQTTKDPQISDSYFPC